MSSRTKIQRCDGDTTNWKEPLREENKREEEKSRRQKDFLKGPEFYGENVFTDFLPPALLLWTVLSQKNRNIIQQIPKLEREGRCRSGACRSVQAMLDLGQSIRKATLDVTTGHLHQLSSCSVLLLPQARHNCRLSLSTQTLPYLRLFL